MTDRKTEPALRPTTTRVAEGSSPRLIALGVAGTLVAVVLIGISGSRPDAEEFIASEPSPRRGSPAVAALATSTVASTDAPLSSQPPRRTAHPTPPRPIDGPVRVGDDAYGVIAYIEGRDYLELLRVVEPGYLSASFRLPFPSSSSTDATLEVAQLWTSNRSRRSHVIVGSWPLPLDGLVRDTNDAGTVIELSVPSRARARRAPLLVRHGYELTVRAESWFDFGIVVVEVRMGSSDIALGSTR